MNDVERFAHALSNAFKASNVVIKDVAADLHVSPSTLYNSTRTHPSRKTNRVVAGDITKYLIEKLDAVIDAQTETLESTVRIQRELKEAYWEVYKNG